MVCCGSHVLIKPQLVFDTITDGMRTPFQGEHHSFFCLLLDANFHTCKNQPLIYKSFLRFARFKLTFERLVLFLTILLRFQSVQFTRFICQHVILTRWLFFSWTGIVFPNENVKGNFCKAIILLADIHSFKNASVDSL